MPRRPLFGTRVETDERPLAEPTRDRRYRGRSSVAASAADAGRVVASRRPLDSAWRRPVHPLPGKQRRRDVGCSKKRERSAGETTTCAVAAPGQTRRRLGGLPPLNQREDVPLFRRGSRLPWLAARSPGLASSEWGCGTKTVASFGPFCFCAAVQRAEPPADDASLRLSPRRALADLLCYDLFGSGASETLLGGSE
ncbi:hypothetical protein HPB50_002256 [Hyalomma asiaticum]|uniref:Uncharacterized protein n=1 Tax=Hyalomma asiaticum TaxID=266040 RepID=A0ACB7TDD8_HYAAI|nr:hypothetical protein HPB50_002256 [Hyalomma asiaticum]